MSGEPPNKDSNPLEGVTGFNAQPASSVSDRMPKIIPFDQLARCGDEIWIECNSQIYRLRRTRQGKLILTK